MNAPQLFLMAGNDGRNTELREVISRAGVDQLKQIMSTNTSGNRNILHVAAEMGCVQNLGTITSALTKQGLLSKYIDSTCKVGMTPLHYAAKVHAKGSIKFLLDQGANVNVQNQTKNTPLHLAADAFGIWMMPFWFVNSYECIVVLVEADGVDLTLKNLAGETPLGISPNAWIRDLKPTTIKLPSTPVTAPTTPITPATTALTAITTEEATEETVTTDTDGAEAADTSVPQDTATAIPGDAERSEADDTSSTGATSADAAAPRYVWNGVPLEDIKPLFDKEATGEDRAASLRLMQRGYLVTLDPTTRAEIGRKECVIKSASTAEDVTPSEQNLVGLKRECDIYQLIQRDRVNTGCVHCYSAHPDFNYLLLESFGRDIRPLLSTKPTHPVEFLEAIAQAVRELHNMSIMHGDIKPQNILYNISLVNGACAVKLCDLDCARRVGEECPAVEVGTKCYVAPEVYLAAAEGKTIKVSLAIDMFSLGLVLWQLISGHAYPALPSPDTADEELRRCYTDQQYLWSKLPLPPQAHVYLPFIQDLTKLDPLQRMTAEQLICKIPELRASNQQRITQQKVKEVEELKQQNEHLNDKVLKKLDGVDEKVTKIMFEMRAAHAAVDGMLRTLISNTHSIPTLAVILPKFDKDWRFNIKPTHIVKNRFRLFFMCSQTREIVKCGPKGRGYKITVTKQWVADAAPVIRIGLIALKLALMATSIPVPVPDITPLLEDRALYAKYVDAALTFVVENGSDKVSEAVVSIDAAINSVKSLEVQTVLSAYSDGVQLEEGSKKAYDTIQALLIQKEKYDVLGTCGLKRVTYNGKTAWIKNDPDVERQFEESLR